MTTYPGKLIAAVVFTLILGAAFPAAAESAGPPRDKPQSEKAAGAALEQWWADLGSSEESKSARALLALARTPSQTVAFLRQRVRAVKADPRRVAKLLEDLDSDSFEKRQTAQQELEYLDKYIKADLEKALEGKVSLEVKLRVRRMLKQIGEDNPKPAAPPVLRGGNISIRNVNGNIEITINGKRLDLTPRIIEKPGPRLSWLRAVRAAAVLEHIGTPEARKVLEMLADGEKDALPSRAAAEALQRLKK
jgi:hypothetical protein